jgi:hypothetical protein
MDNQNGGIHTKFTNIDSNDIKLLLKWGVLIWFFFKESHDLTFTSHITDNNAHEPTLTGLDLST